MIGRLWEICSGKCSVPDEVRFEYLAMWAHEAGDRPENIATMLARWFPSLRKARGVGDIIAQLLSTVGITKNDGCNKCDKRKAWLNQLFPIK